MNIVKILAIYCSVILALGFYVLPDQNQQKINQIKEAIFKTNELIQSTKKDEATQLKALQLLNSQIAYRNDLIKELEKQATSIQDQLNTLKAGSQNDLEQIQQIKSAYSKLLQLQWISKQSNHAIPVSIYAKTLIEQKLYWYWLKQWEAHQKKELEFYSQKLNGYYNKENILKEKLDSVQQVISWSNDEKKKLNTDLEQSKILSKEILTKKQSLEKEIQKYRLEQSQYTQALDEARIQFANANLNSSKTIVSRTDWRFPLPGGVITGRFGRTFQSGQIQSNNNGIDIQSNQSFVTTAHGGEVIQIRQMPDGLFMVLVRDGDLYQLYSKLESVLVRPKETIHQNIQIGKASNKGNSQFQLHFEIWKGKTALNPVDFF
ncbi:MAG TPA: peptidoglycan DD-metalloendopeptidase family protein [Saprospiraceae bacterium]|nr:peptidoglycan DD-metalloendopeptidase family protein [Saprospiraceae bacterium]